MKAQAASEFIIIVSLLLIVLIAALALSQIIRENSSRASDRTESERIASKFASAVNSVAQGGDATNFTFYNAALRNATITFYNYSVYVTVGDATVRKDLLTNRTQVAGLPTENKNITVRNNKGVVIIEG